MQETKNRLTQWPGPLRTVLLAAAFLLAAGGMAGAQELVQRTEVSRADLSGSDSMEVIVTRLELLPGAHVPKHSHPGDEHVYILEGGPLQTDDGRTLQFETGSAFHFPAEQVHAGLTNAGDAPVVALTIHIVDKNRPLQQPAE